MDMHETTAASPTTRCVRGTAARLRWCTLALTLLGVAGVEHVGAATIDEYRFENDLVDSANVARAATILAGTPTFSSNTPTAVLGLDDTASLSLDSSDALRFDYAFPLNVLADATLELFIHPAVLGPEQDVFWTTTAAGDLNRFNIGLVGASWFIDYRESNGTLHALGSATGLSANTWNFVAIVKKGATWSIHVNGMPPVVTVDATPNLPTSTGWTINGRASIASTPGIQFTGLIDSLRISDTALDPSDFLNVGTIFRDGFE